MESRNSMVEVSYVVSRDISNLLSRPFVVISRTLGFLVQFFIFGYTVSTLVSGFNFYQYYGIGTVITTVCSVSYLIGHDLFDEAERGVLDYLLSLQHDHGHGRSILGGQVDIQGEIHTQDEAVPHKPAR